jgi:hypothetical protein
MHNETRQQKKKEAEAVCQNRRLCRVPIRWHITTKAPNEGRAECGIRRVVMRKIKDKKIYSTRLSPFLSFSLSTHHKSMYGPALKIPKRLATSSRPKSRGLWVVCTPADQ